MSRLFAALDGGGSFSRAVLFDAAGTVISRAEGGPVNPNDVGETESAAVLTAVLDRAGASRAEFIFCGLAGAIGHETALANEIKTAFPAAQVCVKSDIFNLLSYLPGDDGAALICGTGSVCFVKKAGELSRIGGWGWLIDGDCGGGFALGRAGLELALRAIDGREPGTALGREAEEFLGGRPDIELGKIYSGGRSFIASFAPRVVSAAAEGDQAAKGAVRRVASGVAEYLSAASAILGEGFDCVCGGGLFREEYFRGAFLKSVALRGIRVGVDFVSAPGAAGAARAALREAGIAPEPGFDERFIKTYREAGSDGR